MCYSEGMTKRVTATEAATLPRAIQTLIAETEAMGGEVTILADRLFSFAFPCRMVSGITCLVERATVGYYVRDGKNVIRGAADCRTEMAYWARQSAPR